MRLLKMHGIGNDYIYADCMGPTAERELGDPAQLAIRISDRHFGVGGDGLILICRSEIADCKMRMFNSDGSEGRMCGNGIRCVGKYIYDCGYVRRKRVTVETLSGVKELELLTENGSCIGAVVDMGVPEVKESVIEVRGQRIPVTLVDVGNPHCILFVDNADATDPADLGPIIETLPEFPHRTNVEFITVHDASHLRMRVWERGTGITFACGTGATASGVAAMYRGLCGREVTVTLDGGDLGIRWDAESGHAFMSGSATYVFDIVNYDVDGTGSGRAG